MDPEVPTRTRRLGALLMFLGCLGVYLALRLPSIGHLLTWDEAMNLLSVRDYYSRATDAYAGWFWMHPPGYPVLLALLRPLTARFAERAELLSMLLGAAALSALYLLNRKTAGRTVALWSCLALALMPGAAFFDVWVKHDALLNVMGLIALLAVVNDKPLWGGLFLGLAFLAKETALFYAIAAFLLIVLRTPQPRRWRSAAALAVTAAAVSGWWYLFFSTSLRQFTTLATGLRLVSVEDWQLPWHYYLSKLPLDLSPLGVVLCGAGLIGLWLQIRKEPTIFLASAWALLFLVPTFLILSLAHERKPWFCVAAYPALATLQGFGLQSVMRFGVALAGPGAPRLARASGSLLAIGVLLLVLSKAIAVPWAYETFMSRQNAGMRWGAHASRQAAQALNQHVVAGQQALITPAYYWNDESTHPDPIFVYYLNPIPVCVRPPTLSGDQYVEAVRACHADWALVSPAPGAASDDVMVCFFRKYGLKPVMLDGALLYETGTLWREKQDSVPPDHAERESR